MLTLAAALRVEWVKAKAHAARWTKQVCLVDEEMRHVIATTQHITKEWNLQQSQCQSQVDSQDLLDADLDEGLTAYADKHCATEMARAAHLEEKWRVVCTHTSDLISGKSPSQLPQRASSKPTTIVKVTMEMSDYGDDNEDDVEDNI